MFLLKHSTASQVIPLGFYLDSTDGNTAETGLTIANTDLQVWKTGATSLVNKNSGGATHMSIGVYQTTLDATDTNTLGPIKIYSHVAGALVVVFEGLIVPVITYDALISNGLNNLGGTAQTADHTAAIADIPTVAEFNARTLPSASYFDFTADNVIVGTNNDKTGYSISGSLTTLDSLNNFNPNTEAVANVTLVATTTTNTDMAGTNNALLAVSYTAPDNAGITQTQVDIAALNNISATDIVTGGAITTNGGVASVDTVKVNGVTVIGTGISSDLWRA